MSSYAAKLLAALQLFDSTRGEAMQLEWRSDSGIGHGHLRIRRPFTAVPVPLLQRLRDKCELRVYPLSRSADCAVDLPAVVAVWKPRTVFTERHAVDLEARAAINAALERFLEPSALVDAGREIGAWWALETPVRAGEAAGVLRRVAAVLGADPPPADLGFWSVPLAGIVRNWNRWPHQYISLATSGAVYPLAAIDAALSEQESINVRSESVPTARHAQGESDGDRRSSGARARAARRV